MSGSGKLLLARARCGTGHDVPLDTCAYYIRAPDTRKTSATCELNHTPAMRANCVLRPPGVLSRPRPPSTGFIGQGNNLSDRNYHRKTVPRELPRRGTREASCLRVSPAYTVGYPLTALVHKSSGSLPGRIREKILSQYTEPDFLDSEMSWPPCCPMRKRVRTVMCYFCPR